MLRTKIAVWGIAVGLCGWGSACSDRADSHPNTHPGRDAGGRVNDAGEPVWNGAAHVVFAPGNAVLRGTRYRMQIQVGLSLGPQQSSTGRYRMQGASAAVIRESQP